MFKLFKKTIISLKQKGLSKTITKIINYLSNILKQRGFNEKVLTLKDTEDRFTLIYKKNYWGNVDSVSGYGSTLESTAKLRNKLPELFEKFSIKSIFDAPCGDFYWVNYVLKENSLNYIGGDIVAPLIESHNLNYKNNSTKFIHIDLTKEIFPDSDLMICRDCLIHLSFNDIQLVLENFIRSNIPYLLTTTYVDTDNFKNKDIVTGDFRKIDLFAAPFYFSKDVSFRIEDGPPDNHSGEKREMCLWTRQQIIDALKRFNNS